MAATVTCPLATAVATPVALLIVAMLGLRLTQATVFPEITFPNASRASAVNVCVPFAVEIVAPAGFTTTVATGPGGTVATGSSRLRVTLSCEHRDVEVEQLVAEIAARS